MIIGGQEFQDGCPKGCPGKDDPGGQGGLCSRCPIFSCTPDGEGFSILPPNDYRRDWAGIWKDWFNSGMLEFPRLPL